jgi:hypothetical protein
MGKAVAKSKKGAWRKLDAADAEVDMPPGMPTLARLLRLRVHLLICLRSFSSAQASAVAAACPPPPRALRYRRQGALPELP